MDTSNDQAIHELIGADLRDSLDEELELELDDRELAEFRSVKRPEDWHPALDRHIYFKELFRMQGELESCRTGSSTTSSRWSWCSRGATPPARAA